MRLAAIFSLVAAVALDASPSPAAHPPTAPSPELLQQRVVALAQQLHLRFESYPVRLAHYRGEVERVLAEWNAAPTRSAADRAVMGVWLDEALRGTLPGRDGRLPGPPQFASSMASSPAPAVQDVQPRAAAKVLPAAAPTAPTPVVGQTPVRRTWSRHPAAAPLEWVDPFVDDQAEENAPAGEDPGRGAAHARGRRPTFASRTVVVDLAELAAEVRGYNEAVSELGRRVAVADRLDAEGLLHVTDELERLRAERAFLDLYRQGLSTAERQALAPSPSAELVTEVIRRRAATLAAAKSDAGEAGGDAGRIEAVQRRLARL